MAAQSRATAPYGIKRNGMRGSEFEAFALKITGYGHSETYRLVKLWEYQDSITARCIDDASKAAKQRVAYVYPTWQQALEYFLPRPGCIASDKRHWLLPPDLRNALVNEFQIDFDPCPHPLPAGFNGLEAEWGNANLVNPPFVKGDGKHGASMIKFVRKSITEKENGKLSVLTLPCPDYICMLTAAGAEIKPLGRVGWLDIETKEPSPHPPTAAAFILRPKAEAVSSFPVPADFQTALERIGRLAAENAELQERLKKKSYGKLGRGEQDRGTPNEVYDPVNEEFQFGLDCAASDQHHKHENYITKEQNALTIKLPTVPIWCNPPWNRIYKFTKKLYITAKRTGQPCVMLVPMWCSEKWFLRFGIHAEIRILSRRVAFEGYEGREAPTPMMLMIFQKDSQMRPDGSLYVKIQKIERAGDRVQRTATLMSRGVATMVGRIY